MGSNGLNRLCVSAIKPAYHAQVGGLAQALFRSLGSSAPRFLHFSHFSHFSCLASVYLFVGGVEGVLSAILGTKHLQ